MICAMRRSIAPPRQRVVRQVPMERAWATAKVWIAHGGARWIESRGKSTTSRGFYGGRKGEPELTGAIGVLMGGVCYRGWWGKTRSWGSRRSRQTGAVGCAQPAARSEIPIGMGKKG